MSNVEAPLEVSTAVMDPPGDEQLSFEDHTEPGFPFSPTVAVFNASDSEEPAGVSTGVIDIGVASAYSGDGEGLDDIVAQEPWMQGT